MKIPRGLNIFLALAGLLALYAAGMCLRRVVLESQYALHGQILPFNMESALQFRYVNMLCRGYALPEIDRDVQAPEGVNVRETYTIGAEYAYAWGAALLPRSLPLSERVRWIALGWFCLGIPLLSLWLWAWTRSAWAAGVGGAFYAVSLAAVMRSTGQELSHENFALPLLIGHLAFGALAETRAGARSFAVMAAISACLLAWALAAWDMIQFFVAVWAALNFFRLLRGRYFALPRRRAGWWLVLAALTAVGAVNPYLRAHGFLLSPAMLLAFGTGAGIVLQQMAPGLKGATRVPIAALLGLAPVAAAFLFPGDYSAAYGHFRELLQAKLLFLNRKPADPSLLSFAQRILWAPALNSVNLRLTNIMFPASMPLFFLALAVVCSRAARRRDPELVKLLWFGCAALPAFILFFRFHVLLIIAVAALLGRAAAWAFSPVGAAESSAAAAPAAPRRGLRLAVAAARGALGVLLLAGIGIEAAHVLRAPQLWGSDPGYLAQKQELARWLRENGVGETVLANFGISAFILTYAGCPIVLHPKFESPEIRRRVRDYGEALFKSDESGFRDWAGRFGPAWYVYSLGEFAPVLQDLQLRYAVDALDPPGNAAARLFEFNPNGGRYFRFVWGNLKYRVFRIIRREDERRAETIALEAEEEFSRGQLAGAELKATLAMMHDPHSERARKVLLHVASMREQGVQ